jgi:short-subunit dehydrogenase
MAEARALALVTGASSGIGFVVAKLFADDGYDLIVAGDDDGIHASADKLAGSRVDVRPVQVDFRKPDDAERLYRSATEEGRRLDAAAPNAGVGRSGRFVDGDLDHDVHIVDLNVRSTVHPAKLVLRDMAARGRERFCSRRRSWRRCPARIRASTTRRSLLFSRSPKLFTMNCATPT